MPYYLLFIIDPIYFESFLGMRKFTAALDYFQQAITLPAQALSAIVIASLKASKLASLIESGTAFEVPKYVRVLTMQHFVSSYLPGVIENIDCSRLKRYFDLI